MTRPTTDQARANRPRRQTSPRAAAGAGRRWRYDGAHARRGDEDRDPALDPARRAPDPAASDLGRGGRGSSRRLPLPRRSAARAAPEPARARARARVDSAWARRGDRLPELCRCCRFGGRGTRDRGREPDAELGRSRRLLLYGRAWTEPPDARRTRSRPAPALARPPPPEAGQDPQAGPGLPRQHRGERRAEIHVEGDLLGRGRRDLRLPAPLLHGADRRDLDLHAPRHAAALTRGRPALSAPSRLAAARHADGAGDRGLREGAGAPVADHRGERRPRALGARGHRGRARSGQVRPPLRHLGRADGADPLPRAVARRGAALRVRARRAPALGALGGDPLPRHPPGRGAHRGAERDGKRAPAPPAARHLRPPRRWRDLRPAGCLRRAAAARGRARLLGVLLGAGQARAVAGGRAGAGRGRAPAARACARAGAAARAARSSGAVILRARAVSRSFGRDVALAPTDLVVSAGEVVALVGPNGAGKSTLLALLAGALEPSEGAVERAEGVRIGWAPQRPAFYGRLTPRENLEFFARLEGEADPAAAAAGLLGAFELPDGDRSSGTLSVGNRQRLNLAIALLGSPRVLLLDEPTASLDPGQRRRLWETAATVAHDGGAVCFATQNLDEVEAVADRMLALQDGVVVYEGAPAA